jgi:hypothetical protein
MKFLLLSFLILAVIIIPSSNGAANESITNLSTKKLVILKRIIFNNNNNNNNTSNDTNKWYIGSNSTELNSKWSSHHQLNKSISVVPLVLFKSVVYRVPLKTLINNSTSNSSISASNQTSISVNLVHNLINNFLNGSNAGRLNQTYNKNNISLIIFPILFKTNTSSVNVNNSRAIEHLKEIINNRLMMRKNSSENSFDSVYRFKIESFEKYNNSENIKANNMTFSTRLPVLKLVYIQQLVCFDYYCFLINFLNL